MTKPRYLLPLILVVALALRLYGLHWGIPDATHTISSYHPDEVPTMLQAEFLGEGVYRPQQFIYGGSLYFRLVRSFLFLGDQFAPQLDQYNFTANAVLAGRYVMVYIALLTLLLLYEAVRCVRGEGVALLATGLLAITPSHVITAQQVRPDEVGVFFVVLQLLFAAKVLQAPTEQSARRLLWWAALIGGVMLAFRFPLVLFFAMPMLAWLLRPGRDFWKSLLSRLWPAPLPVAILLIVAGYAVSSPETFTHFAVFKAGMELQWRFQSNPFEDAVGLGPIPWQYWWDMLHQSLGYPFYFLALAAFALACWRRHPLDWILLVGLLPYAVMVSMTTWVVVRYTLPLVPLLVVMQAEALQWAAARFGVKPVAAVAAVAALVTLWATLAFVRMEAAPNVRALAQQWVEANVKPDQCLLMVKAYEAEEMYNPYFDQDRCSGIMQLQNPDNDYHLAFSARTIPYVMLHQHMYASMERLGKDHPDPAHAAFYAELMADGYRVEHEVKVEPVLWGVNFSSWFTSLDMTYVNPTFRIYHKQVAATQ
ncbi:MAG TPA: glycosyltransferase family 39 protein [Candidatus Acidoferrum sp.]|nr:glycosyltransferase family 39 protein [Candidatus Acidoferrum sp.]